MSIPRSLIIVCLFVLGGEECFGLDLEARKGFDEALLSVEEHQFPSTELINDPVNREWVENLRGGALKLIGGPGDVLFLNLGDPEIMQRYLEAYHADPSEVVGTLLQTIQPKIIAAIANDFYRDEPVTIVWKGDLGDYHSSMWACLITQKIIKNSPVFNQRLKDWANDNPFRRLGDEDAGLLLRDEMRVWWSENRALFEAERYTDVKPPSTWNPDGAPTQLEKSRSVSTQRIVPTPPDSKAPFSSQSMEVPVSEIVSETEVKSPSTLPWILGIALIAAIIIGSFVMRRKM